MHVCALLYQLNYGWLFILKMHEICEYACVIWCVRTEIGMPGMN